MVSISSSVEIRKGKLGYVLQGQKGEWFGVTPPKRARGDIKGFSNASARRLREIMATMKPLNDEWVLFGFTFTIPGDVLPPARVRKIWSLWVHRFKRKFFSPMLWRIELQERKQAHWHCLIWIPKERGGPAELSAVLIKLEWLSLIRSQVGALSTKTDIGFEFHGVNIKRLDESTPSGIIGYLADHTSKHKQAQLGWVGRQWGIVNRHLLRFETDLVCSVDNKVHLQAARQYRRLQKNLRERGGSYTGVRVSPNSNVSKVVFGRDADRIIALEQYFASQS